MLDLFTQAMFASLVGKPFRVHLNDADSVEVELVEALALPIRPRSRREQPFSLVFRGPKDRLLLQQTYAVDQESLGKFELFLVPIQPDAEGFRYEAIFN